MNEDSKLRDREADCIATMWGMGGGIESRGGSLYFFELDVLAFVSLKNLAGLLAAGGLLGSA